MTVNKLISILNRYEISLDVKMMSDCGYECSATEMNGIYYNSKTNTLIFTQYASNYDKYCDNPDWKCLTDNLRD